MNWALAQEEKTGWKGFGQKWFRLRLIGSSKGFGLCPHKLSLMVEFGTSRWVLNT